MAAESHKSETDSLNRRIASLVEDSTNSQSIITELRTKLLDQEQESQTKVGCKHSGICHNGARTIEFSPSDNPNAKANG